MKVAFQTNVGKKRSTNQDSVGMFINEAKIPLAIVADGLGGHQAGDVASQLTVNELGKSWESNSLTDEKDISTWLTTSIQHLNEVIYTEGQLEEQKAGMGTTIVAAVILNNRAILASVGDSRIYVVRNEAIEQLTEDHSLVNELLKKGEITKEMAQKHPRKNVLVRSLGIPETLDVDLTTFDIIATDQLLLCSDGLSNMLSDEMIQTIMLAESDIAKRVTTLVDQANEAGGKDNITVLILDFKEEKGG